ncbi:MAG: tripartite tricarboxylate transporter substrate binding protein [Betaproteobacteria bacterium]|nr:tripartite tricarboxylate transporter substrate binding protein [Betaproteobacteria bacterium]
MHDSLKAAIALCIAAATTIAWAQRGAADFPSHPIRIVVGYAPGGTTDIFSRILGAHLTQSLGQQVIVDTRPGAAAQIASNIVAKATPDGHTLLMTPSGSHTINPSLYKKLPYDTLKDFAPITLVAWVTNLIVTHPTSPINTLQDLITFAKAKPGQLTYASSGNGTITHLAGEMLKSLVNINMVHVPYKGGGVALVAIAANETSIMFAALPSATPFLQSKRIKPLAVMSPQRVSVLPDVPTVAEAGVPGIGVMEWYGAFAPAGTPRAIIEKLNAEIARIVRKPEARARFAELGADPVGNSAREFAKQVESDVAMWTKIVRSSGARAGD